MASYLSCGVVHHLLRCEVTLVAYEQLVDVLAGVAVDLLEPLFHVVEGLLRTERHRLIAHRAREVLLAAVAETIRPKSSTMFEFQQVFLGGGSKVKGTGQFLTTGGAAFNRYHKYATGTDCL